jgi:PAS domain S-box-containing protein
MATKPTYQELGKQVRDSGVAESIRTWEEDELKEIFSMSLDMICIADLNSTNFIKVNPAFTDSLGYTENELLGKPFMDLVHPEDLDSTLALIGQKLNLGINVLNFENRYRRKNGVYIWLNWSAQPNLEKGVAYAIARDINARKAVEAGLEKTRKDLALIKKSADEAHEFADSVINTVREPLISLDQDLRVVSVSRSFYEFFKVKPEETVGELIFNLGNKQWDIPQLRVLLENILPEKSAFDNYEVEHDFATIGRRTMLLNARQIEQGMGKEHVILLAIEDITERKWLEDELLKAQKLDSLGVFAGGIAHDFNNILTTILGNVSMAKLGLLPEDVMFGLLKEAELASVRAQTLTKQLLTFAKGGAPVKEIASISEILELSPSFVLRGSKSKCDISVETDLWSAEVDVGQISQVINNLVINANQAMPEGGIIRVTAENLKFDQQLALPLGPGRHIKIAVHDQGGGIEKEHLANIFDPYFTTKKEGSGLGLASTYSIIMKHAGHITVESLVGAGSTFCVYLPASVKKHIDRLATSLIKGQGKILVMDDEVSLRKMMGVMLGILGYSVEFAKDGNEAMQMVRQAKESGAPFDAAILDLTIPGGLGGKDAIKPLLEIDPSLKAIVFSGYSDDPVLANFAQYGFKGMLVKPFKSQALGKVLHDVLQENLGSE